MVIAASDRSVGDHLDQPAPPGGPAVRTAEVLDEPDLVPLGLDLADQVLPHPDRCGTGEELRPGRRRGLRERVTVGVGDVEDIGEPEATERLALDGLAGVSFSRSTL